MKNHFRFQDIRNQARTISEKGTTGLFSIGWASAEGLIAARRGFPWVIYGNPGAGKSEATSDIAVNLAKLYGWRCIGYFGEGGDIPEIYLEFMHKVLGKKYEHATEAEKIYAEQFVNEHFFILNPDEDYTITEFHEAIEKAEKDLGIKFDLTILDPWNDLILETDRFNGREDHYLAYALKKVRIASKKNNRIDILVNHVADIKAVTDKDGNRYMPPATANELNGGRTWWRRSFVMLLVYRPPVFLKDENGIPFAENETHIYIQKIKPKHTGKLGIIKMFYDWKRNQYYSYTSTGQLLYSCEKVEDLKPKQSGGAK